MSAPPSAPVPPFHPRVVRSADDGGVPGVAAAQAGGGEGARDGAGVRRVRAECTIVNQRGLHARAAARFVKTVERFDAAVKVFSRGQEVSGHSIMGLMMLAAGPGSVIQVVCEGREAQEVLEALQALIAGRFHED